MEEEDEDNNLPNQIAPPEQQASVVVSATVGVSTPPADTNIDNFETSDLPLPSPSASPQHSAHVDDEDERNDAITQLPQQATLSSSNVINMMENLITSTLSNTALNNLVFKLVQQMDRSTLSDMSNSIDKCLKRDFLTDLPPEVSFKILKELDYSSLNNILLVSKGWNRLIDGEFWKNLLIKDDFITKNELVKIGQTVQSKDTFQNLYIKRFNLNRNWVDPTFEPKRISIPSHGSSVISCLLFDDEKIITGADDRMINIYNPENGKLLSVLKGHEGGVWALKYTGNQVVSGSTDRTVRVWNIKTEKCTHIFKGHTSTIRCMEIVEDEETGEKLIITGSRDNTLHVWRLPDEDDDGSDFNEDDPQNPYFVTVLRGHTASVRAVTGHGNLLVSGSYDNTLRVWDLKTRKTKFVLTGHNDRIYSTILDLERNRCISASMDSTIRVWDLSTGKCLSELVGHKSLVGLLGLSSRFLVSAAADGTLRAWDPNHYKNEFTLHHDHHIAITTFYATPNILVSGSERQFNVYDLKNKGRLVRSNLLNDCGQIWSAKFSHSRCIIAVQKNGNSYIEILDFSESV